jgi:hypothetical protein
VQRHGWIAVLAMMAGGCGSSGGAGAGSSGGAGVLALEITTEMQTPKDLSTVSIFVTEGPDVKLDLLEDTLPDGTLSLPDTIELPDAPGASVRIRV